MKTDWIKKRYGRIKVSTIKRRLIVIYLRKLGFTFQAMARYLEVSVPRIQQFEKDYLRDLPKDEAEIYRKEVKNPPFRIPSKLIIWKVKELTLKEVKRSILL